MRHRVGGRKFGLPSDQRRALLKGLVRSLLIFQKIKTTETRAKDIRIIAERVITSAKRANTLHSRRQVNRYLTDETLTKHVFDVIAPEFKDTPGGYTRLVKIGQRRGDAAPIVMLELSTDKDLGRPVLPEKIGTKRTEKTW
jgi:large subunit ribosomal protein L17